MLLRRNEKSVIMAAGFIYRFKLFFEGNDIVKILKLIVGILCILLAAFLALQTFLLGAGNALVRPLEVSGISAFVIIALLFVCGVIMVSSYQARGVGGEVFCIILFSLGTASALLFNGRIADLQLWAWICLGLSVFNLISLFTK